MKAPILGIAFWVIVIVVVAWFWLLEQYGNLVMKPRGFLVEISDPKAPGV